jgi:cytochrome b561
MNAANPRFTALSRLLHWLMAAMVLAMLFIGVAMVSTVSPAYIRLVSIHKPLGIAILVLVMIRIVNRWLNPPPQLPADLPTIQKIAAKASHIVLYGLMLALPIVGWSMLSAGDLPIVLFGTVRLPAILAPSPMLYADLRQLHTVLAYLFFLTIVVHMAAALFHGLIRRDGVLSSMASWRLRK